MAKDNLKEDDTTAVVKKKKQVKYKKSTVFLVVFLLVILWMGYIFRNATATSRGYELNTLQISLKKINEENTYLHLDIAHLKSPERIQEIATKKLGMVLPDKFFFANDKNN